MAKKTISKASKKSAKNTAVKKTAAKKPAAKKTIAKKAVAKKVVAKKTVAKKVAKAPPKTSAKRVVVKAPAKIVKIPAGRVPVPGTPVTPRREPWQNDLRDFVRAWRRKHPHVPGTKGAKMTRTFLKVTRTAKSHTEAAGLGQKHIPVLVQNLGNVAAYTCVVRALEARPRSPIHEKIPLSEFTLGGQLIFTLQPGEQKEVRIPYLRTRANGTFVALISDPLLDPNELTVADMNHRRILLFNLV